MSIAVMILLVVSVSESGKRGLFWIVYNYSTKALLNSFELYTPYSKMVAISDDLGQVA